MYEGYLALGGGEVLNSARSVGYTTTADCPVAWLVCPPCDGIADALGHNPYFYANISEAPWYDEEDEPTHRFLGAHGIEFEGIPDSTREANVAEGILDGGVVGKVRHGTRRMRVRAMLTAIGEDALEVGFSWLESALTPGKCGTHGDACGAADARMYAACPPTQESVTSAETIWNDPVTNLARNPSFETAVGDQVSYVSLPNTAQATMAQIADPVSGSFANRFTLVTTDIVGLPVIDFLPVAGTVYTLVGKVRAVTRDTLFNPRIAGADGSGFLAPAGIWTPFRVTIAAGTGTVGQTGLVLTANGGHQVGDFVDLDDVLVMEGDYSGPYFDGDIPDSAPSTVAGTVLGEFEWTGTPHASESIGRTGLVTMAPDPILYEEKLLRMVRNLHTVTCVSGPTVVQKMHRGNTWGYLVEFVLVAAVPWMYGDTRPVVLEPSSPVVIQDVPFNLVPYPSAELALGTVIAATNYSTNPSAEAGITGWQVDTDGTKIPSAQVALFQSNELASVGAYSAKAAFTAAGTDAGGWFGLGQLVELPGITSTTRFSTNIWMSASVETGTAVLGDVAAYVYWQDAGGATIRVDEIGVEPAAGGAISMQSILPPPGTAKAFMNTRVNVASWSAGAVVRFYADALAVTVP